MEKYIKYKRFAELLEPHEIQKYLDNIIIEGWEIIYYNETKSEVKYSDSLKLKVVIIGGRKQDNVL